MSDVQFQAICKAIEERLKLVGSDAPFTTGFGTNVRRGFYAFDNTAIKSCAVVFFVEAKEIQGESKRAWLNTMFDNIIVIGANKLIGKNEVPQDVSAALYADIIRSVEGTADNPLDMTLGGLVNSPGMRLVNVSLLDDPFKMSEANLAKNYACVYAVYSCPTIKSSGVA